MRATPTGENAATLSAEDGCAYLRAAGTSVLVDARRGRSARVLHWGADLGELSPAQLAAQLDSWGSGSRGFPLLPARAEAYLGRPAVSGHRIGRDWSPAFRVQGVDRSGPGRLAVTASDAVARLRVRTELELPPAGLLRLRHMLRNEADTPYVLDGLLVVLPIPARVTELLDFTGRWSRERQPQRHPLPHGTWARESRVGRTGHDATIGLVAGTPGFGFRDGELWAVHVAWSGDHTTFAERDRTGRAALGGGELLAPGEVVLQTDEEYATPWVYAAYSPAGLDPMSAAFHQWLRSRPHHPRPERPRPVTLNTWEAVWFDHDLDRLLWLAELGHRIGAERFVLDDGWFRHRRDDHAGLGDWYVDETVWPRGLHPLVDRVRELGMEFGLWVEPEMVNPDSDLYRAHRDWILASGGRIPPAERNQQVLDLANADAYAYVLGRLDALLSEYEIAYLKWDHNRDLVEPGHAGRPATRLQTLAVYRLLDELRARHPGVEIESCAGGGGRIDFGILDRTDRVWASDCTDPLERQAIQRWTGLFLPPELIGAHVARPHSHQTGRMHDLSFRAATALFAHFGVEWDLTEATDEELETLRGWVQVYRRVRSLLHSGTVVHADLSAGSEWLYGVVAPDRMQALYAFVQLATPVAQQPGAVPLVGLDADRTYRVAPVDVSRPRLLNHYPQPDWLAGGVSLPGRVLTHVGLPMPGMYPEQALVFSCSAGPAPMGAAPPAP